MIQVSIDVTLLDKSRIKEVTRKNGKVAKFVELVLIDTPNGKYGDYMVKQSVSREDRNMGVELPILGNGKIFERSQGGPPPQPAEPKVADPNDDEVPF
jgi:hypothetical protein